MNEFFSESICGIHNMDLEFLIGSYINEFFIGSICRIHGSRIPPYCCTQFNSVVDIHIPINPKNTSQK